MITIVIQKSDSCYETSASNTSVRVKMFIDNQVEVEDTSPTLCIIYQIPPYA